MLPPSCPPLRLSARSGNGSFHCVALRMLGEATFLGVPAHSCAGPLFFRAQRPRNVHPERQRVRDQHDQARELGPRGERAPAGSCFPCPPASRTWPSRTLQQCTLHACSAWTQQGRVPRQQAGLAAFCCSVQDNRDLGKDVKPGTFVRSFSKSCFNPTRDIVLPVPFPPQLRNRLPSLLAPSAATLHRQAGGGRSGGAGQGAASTSTATSKAVLSTRRALLARCALRPLPATPPWLPSPAAPACRIAAVAVAVAVPGIGAAQRLAARIAGPAAALWLAASSERVHPTALRAPCCGPTAPGERPAPAHCSLRCCPAAARRRLTCWPSPASTWPTLAAASASRASTTVAGRARPSTRPLSRTPHPRECGELRARCQPSLASGRACARGRMRRLGHHADVFAHGRLRLLGHLGGAGAVQLTAVGDSVCVLLAWRGGSPPWQGSQDQQRGRLGTSPGQSTCVTRCQDAHGVTDLWHGPTHTRGTKAEGTGAEQSGQVLQRASLASEPSTGTGAETGWCAAVRFMPTGLLTSRWAGRATTWFWRASSASS